MQHYELPQPSGRWRWGRRGRRLASAAESLIAAAAILVIAASLAVLSVLAFDPERGEQWTSGLRPSQFFHELDADLLEDYADVFGVAHNSGDSVTATLEALSYGADVIEADVVAVDGRLYAAHNIPLPVLGGELFRGPPLDQIWVASSAADAIKLDLKDSSPAFYELVLRFLAQRQGQQRVIIVTGDVNALRLFAEREPTALRFFSIGNARQYDRLVEDATLGDLIDGVSIRHTLLDDDRAGWLQEHDILTLAWTVNDLARVNELVLLGVDAITTDNLAIMKLLGGQQRGERRLTRLREPPPELLAPSTPVSASAGRSRPRA